MIGLYCPGDSLVHRLPAGVKLALLLTSIVAMTVFVRSPLGIAVVAVAVAGLFALARISWRVAVAQLRPVLWMTVIIAVFQLLTTSVERAVVVCGALVISVALAALVTVTTRVTAMLDALTRALRPLRGIGVDPERVGVLLALAIRCVPLLAGIVHDVAQARRARGVSWSATALVTPVLVRALRTADAMGEALAARGVDDD
ncbi:energy-coupling factor transporter transmembrane component T family protein [Nocardia mangyaensis]|uniref:energy-coupling factor transporter transmembrane component T family protein n=1 Tax=Nocardia mangyaensis TaxID=2213200 RepID=UPI00267586D6|nr:energy-coupling factor transporter transmembrane protein EcfT [Nocardia mangyaensis]MDO3649034.1 energy-coupling factor transporter transmembrane protein EcfT [Nocardia mangyaensis]